jgi:hypothetical protein
MFELQMTSFCGYCDKATLAKYNFNFSERCCRWISLISFCNFLLLCHTAFNCSYILTNSSTVSMPLWYAYNMSMLFLLTELFVFGFLLNMVWEVWHSQLYTTCLKQEWTKNVRLLTIMSLKDAFFIVLFYLTTVFIFGSYDIFNNSLQLVFFVLISLSFSFVDEKISIKKKRWEYAPTMPTVFGVGITPLLEIAITGVLALVVVFFL